MPLYLTGAHSSAFKRSNTAPSLERSTSSSFSSHARTKSTTSRKRPNIEDDDNDEPASRLDDTGKTLSLAANSKLRTVPEAIEHCLENMFGDIPERAGMNSTRIAETLNFRKALPPIVSMAHVHSLIGASTRTEREIAQMITTGQLRKIAVAGRGNDISGLGEFIVRVNDLEKLIESANLKEGCKKTFLELLRQNPRASQLSARLLDPADLIALVKAGFLVSSSAYNKIKHGTSSASTQFSPLVATAAQTPTGSAAVASTGSFENLRAGGASQYGSNHEQSLALSLPNVGPYLRLLNDARNHFVELLGKSKYREAPAYLLKERWDGAVESDNRVSVAKRRRGEFAGILPGRTRRWKQLHGLEFEWILQECLGAGLVEHFETHSVGIGVRAV